ncbi:AP-4-A phosphorylase [Phycisphaerae bacterium RAS1]|nr:AP-4-A phosphorylase [Phycisphaerae bacterium RAS1]
MPESQKNLWAPWRMQYLENIDAPAGGCFLCRYRDDRAGDEANHVVWRSESLLLVLNRFPYNNGHLLVAPTLHQGKLEDLPEGVLTRLMLAVRDAQRVLAAALNAQGFNIGLNLGHCAGAGLPDHLHFHIVPRWGGDTNFMPVLSDVKVIPEALTAVQRRFVETAARLGLFP